MFKLSEALFGLMTTKRWFGLITDNQIETNLNNKSRTIGRHFFDNLLILQNYDDLRAGKTLSKYISIVVGA